MLTSLTARLPLSAELVAFCIVERPDAPPAWVRCGSARIAPDGSVRVRLDALPLSGELHLRPPSVPTVSAARSAPPARGKSRERPLNS